MSFQMICLRKPSVLCSAKCRCRGGCNAFDGSSALSMIKSHGSWAFDNHHKSKLELMIQVISSKKNLYMIGMKEV